MINQHFLSLNCINFISTSLIIDLKEDITCTFYVPVNFNMIFIILKGNAYCFTHRP